MRGLDILRDSCRVEAIEQTERRGTMVREVVLWLSCATMLTAGGCVMKSTYDAAVQEGETTKSELDRAREEQKLLARQVSQIERSNAEALRDAEATTAAVQQAKDEAERQRQLAEEQIAKLKQRIAQLTKQHGTVQYELAVATENTAALQELVEVYQRKVRDSAGAGVTTSPLPETTATKPFDPATIPTPQDLPPPTPALEPSKPIAAPAPEPSPVSQKPAAEPKDSSWLSGVKEWIISLWRSVFS
jgi:flagellar motility protein MotE (MotC chaperone)